jgi:REG-2-like HAD superfamily hydrolase
MFYDTVIFDAAGTLLGRETPDYFETFFVIAAQEVGHTMTLEEVKAALARVFEDPDRRLHKGRMSTPDQARRFWVDLYGGVLKEAGIPGNLKAGLERFYDRFQEGHFLDVYSDVRPTLDSLAAHGIRLGILSNWSEHLTDILERFDLSDYFAFTVISAEVGCEKPDGRIFDIAVSRANTPHDRILYIGDHPEEDIHPAQQIGIDALLIDRYDKHTRYRLPSIRQLTDIPQYVGIEAL